MMGLAVVRMYYFKLTILIFICYLIARNIFHYSQLSQPTKTFLVLFFLIYFLLLSFYIIGKSFLLKTIANYALEQGLNVCVSAPTGKLSSTYSNDLPMYRFNTVHSNFLLPVNSLDHPNTIHCGLSDVHVRLVDEVIKYII